MLGPIPLRGSDRVGQVVSAHLPYSVQAPKRGEGQTQEGHWAAISHYATALQVLFQKKHANRYVIGAPPLGPLGGIMRGAAGRGSQKGMV